MDWSECKWDNVYDVNYYEIEWLLGSICIRDSTYFNGRNPNSLEDAKRIVEEYINEQTTEIINRLNKFTT